MKEIKMSQTSKKEIVIGVTGGIAAYKTADLVNKLAKSGFNVQVVMTRSATQFVQPLTFSTLSHNKVHLELFEQSPQPNISHIVLAKETDLVVIAPATANLIAKIAHGIADDLLTSTILATNFRVPILICPSMNTEMLNNPITQENLKKLKQLGYKILGPRVSVLACGDEGKGAMSTIEDIQKEIENSFKK
jgi:phosphopantothenoylcysteine decarboxylase